MLGIAHQKKKKTHRSTAFVCLIGVGSIWRAPSPSPGPHTEREREHTSSQRGANRKKKRVEDRSVFVQAVHTAGNKNLRRKWMCFFFFPSLFAPREGCFILLLLLFSFPFLIDSPR
jgi:hypothetical protein